MPDELHALRAVLEATQAELQTLRTRLTAEEAQTAALRDRISELLGELERANGRAAEAVADRERVARLLLERSINPTGQRSAFSVESVDALVAFLKQLK